MPGNRRTSIVWKYFTDIGNFSSICNICKEQLSYKTTISNLKKHLDRKHPKTCLLKRNDVGNKNESCEIDIKADDENSDEYIEKDEDITEARDSNATDSQMTKRVRRYIKNNAIDYYELQPSKDELERIEVEGQEDDDADPMFVEFLEHAESSPILKRDSSSYSSPARHTNLRKKRKRHISHKEVNDEEENQTSQNRLLLEIKRLELETFREKNLYEKEKARAQIDRDTVKVHERFVTFLEDIKPSLIKFLNK